MNEPSGIRFGRTIRVDGGIKAKSERGAIGQSWWSKRFLGVLESFALGTRLTRGRSYARAGQVLELTVAPGRVAATVQGSRPKPYQVVISLSSYPPATWEAIEVTLAKQAIFSARLLAGDMPAEIEDVFTAAGAPLFPTTVRDLSMSCSCPDVQVPCKHIAAAFYLLAESFDDDPFEILHWRGRDKPTLLARLRALRTGEASRTGDRPSTAPRRSRAKRTTTTASGGAGMGTAARPTAAAIGAQAALADVTSPPLSDVIDRFWIAPVPLTAAPSTLAVSADLLLRQLPPPPREAGGGALLSELRQMYQDFSRSDLGADAVEIYPPAPAVRSRATATRGVNGADGAKGRR